MLYPLSYEGASGQHTEAPADLRRHIPPYGDLGVFGLLRPATDHPIGVCDRRGPSGMPGWHAVTLAGSLRGALAETPAGGSSSTVLPCALAPDEEALSCSPPSALGRDRPAAA